MTQEPKIAPPFPSRPAPPMGTTFSKQRFGRETLFLALLAAVSPGFLGCRAGLSPNDTPLQVTTGHAPTVLRPRIVAEPNLRGAASEPGRLSYLVFLDDATLSAVTRDIIVAETGYDTDYITPHNRGVLRVVVSHQAGSPQPVAASLSRIPNVLNAAPDSFYIVKRLTGALAETSTASRTKGPTPIRRLSDPFWSAQWNVHVLAAPDLWPRAAPPRAQTRVAILDNGLFTSAPDLAAFKDNPGFPVQSQDRLPSDPKLAVHGTAVASVIFATGNNGHGIAGLCWGQHQHNGAANYCVPVNIFGTRDESTLASFVEGIYRASAKRVAIINASIEFNPLSKLTAVQHRLVRQLMIQALDYAARQGCVVVCAAGNDGRDLADKRTLPQTLQAPNLIKVAGLRAVVPPELSADSCHSVDLVDIAAPANDIPCLAPYIEEDSEKGSTLRLYYGNGTSYAAPLVSGMLAAAWESLDGNRINYAQTEAERARLVGDLVERFLRECTTPVPALAGSVRLGRVLKFPPVSDQ